MFQANQLALNTKTTKIVRFITASFHIAHYIWTMLNICLLRKCNKIFRSPLHIQITYKNHINYLLYKEKSVCFKWGDYLKYVILKICGMFILCIVQSLDNYGIIFFGGGKIISMRKIFLTKNAVGNNSNSCRHWFKKSDILNTPSCIFNL